MEASDEPVAEESLAFQEALSVLQSVAVPNSVDEDAAPEPFDEEHLDQIVAVLKQLAGELEAIRLISDVDKGGPRQRIRAEWVVSALNRGFDKEEVLQTGCLLLREMAFERSVARDVGRNNGIQVVIEAIEQYSFKKEVAVAGISALQMLCEDEENAFLTADFGGIEAVAQLMSIYDDDGTLQMELVSLLMRIVARGARKNKELLGKCNGIRQVLEILSRYKEDLELQRKACEAIAVFVDECPNNKNVVKHEDGCRLIVNCLESFPSDPQIRMHCLWALAGLTFENDGNQQAVGSLAMPLLLKLASRDLKCFDAMLLLQILRNVTENNATNQMQLGMMGGIPLIVNLIERHSGQDEIFVAGCKALSNTQYAETFHEAIYKCDGIRVLFDGFQNLLGQPDRLEVVTETLNAATAGSEGASREAKNLGIVPLLIEALESYDSPGLQTCGLQILTGVSNLDEDAIFNVSGYGGVGVALEALKEVKNTREVHEQAVKLLLSIARDDDCAKQIEEDCDIRQILENARANAGRFSSIHQDSELLLERTLGGEDRPGLIRSIFTRERSKR